MNYKRSIALLFVLIALNVLVLGLGAASPGPEPIVCASGSFVQPAIHMAEAGEKGEQAGVDG